jgi:hypothetical protein
MRVLAIFGLAVIMLAVAVPGRADETADLKRQVADLKAQMEKMQADHQRQIDALKEQIDALSAKVEEAEGQQETQQEVIESLKEETSAVSRTAAGQQSMNPDVSAIIDWTGSLFSHTNENKNGFDLREVELGFSGEIDPYARADIFLGIGGGEIDVEEGYLTAPHLTQRLQAKAGKFLVEFGRANATHLHALPWVAKPVVLQTYLGEEGVHGTGLSFSYLLPTRHFSELTLQGFEADCACFASLDTNKLAYLAHWSNFFELSAASSLAIGASYTTGPSDPDNTRLGTTLWGADLTYKWRPPQEGLYKSLWWQSEGYWSSRDLAEGESVNAWGMYSSLTYQFQQRWSAGLRYDYVQDPLDNALRQRQWVADVTLSPSEFQFWRLEFRHGTSNFNDSENQWWLQYDAGIGPHRAHKW